MNNLLAFGLAADSAALFIFIFMSVFFLYALACRRNDIADVIWGIGVMGVAWTTVIFFSDTPRSVLLAVLVSIWGLRLSTHIFLRNRNKEEDFRYKAWREQWGKWFTLRSYLQIFLLQGFLMLLISLPVTAQAADLSGSIWWVTILGVIIWIKGFVFEAGGDYQLARFIKNPENKGRLMTAGLWSYTRHPNYYGEVTQWWGIYVASLPLALSMIWPVWIIALLGPLTITFLILKVSGIPMLEKKYEGNADFDAYKARTNAFFPWFPKKG